MQRPPLPVDPVDNFWDIMGAVGDFVGGVGAAFALVVAALTYRRQVNESQRKQAFAVVLRVTPDEKRDGLYAASVHNESDQPISLEDFRVRPVSDQTWLPVELTPGMHILKENVSRLVGYGSGVPEGHRMAIFFRDAGGGAWLRYLNGELERLPRLAYSRPALWFDAWLVERKARKWHRRYPRMDTEQQD